MLYTLDELHEVEYDYSVNVEISDDTHNKNLNKKYTFYWNIIAGLSRKAKT